MTSDNPFTRSHQAKTRKDLKDAADAATKQRQADVVARNKVSAEAAKRSDIGYKMRPKFYEPGA